MNSLRITLVQTSLVWENPTANCANLEEELNHLQGNTDVVILPEMFTTGFSINSVGSEFQKGPSLQWMQLIANRLDALVLGSIKCKESGKLYNRLFAVFPDGNFASYDKKHLFRMGQEPEVYSSGTKRQIINYKGFSIALFICYDLRFPVWIRNKNQEYDLAVFVANWPAARAEAWKTLLKARAIENLSYVAGVNIVGEDGNLLKYQGDSALINFKGEALLDLADRKSIETFEIFQKDLLEFREKFPAHLDADPFSLD